jgi:hypothetical protein
LKQIPTVPLRVRDAAHDVAVVVDVHGLSIEGIREVRLAERDTGPVDPAKAVREVRISDDLAKVIDAVDRLNRPGFAGGSIP